jgi:hypothetical protein
MTNLEMPPEAAAPIQSAGSEAELLFALQLLVARRADALARRTLPASREGDRRVWLRAEREIFDRADVRRIAPLCSARLWA